MTVRESRERLEKCGWALDWVGQCAHWGGGKWEAEVRQYERDGEGVVWRFRSLITSGHRTRSAALDDLVARVERMEGGR